MRQFGARLYMAAGAFILAGAALASAALAALGGILYGTSDDRAFPYVLLPAPTFTVLGWAVLLIVFGRSGSGRKGAAWLVIAAVALPFVAVAAVQIAFGVGGDFHHSPACPAQHLGPC